MPHQSSGLTKIHYFLFAALLASFIIAFYPVWKSLILTWYVSNDYSHGFFIVPLACFIVWQKKETFLASTIRPLKLGLLFIVLSLLIYIFSVFAEIKTLSSFSIILVIASIIVYLLGFQILKNLVFPLFLLLFMIPVPEQIYSSLTIPLQLFVSKISVGISTLVGISVFREGNVIHLPERTLQVVQACSGLRSLITLLTLSALFAYFSLRSNLLRTVLFFSGVPFAVVVNIIRVLIIILTFYYFDKDLTSGSIHTVFGVIIFALAILLLFLFRQLLIRWDRSTTEA